MGRACGSPCNWQRLDLRCPSYTSARHLARPCGKRGDRPLVGKKVRFIVTSGVSRRALAIARERSVARACPYQSTLLALCCSVVVKAYGTDGAITLDATASTPDAEGAWACRHRAVSTSAGYHFNGQKKAVTYGPTWRT
ncbi:hypothetical protein WR25_06822 [Diploscapter pachys]|uniref:Uncharacterized protein n=1 Tax=Diploscapter pachys TaxID=2018661 RepID=A0A2A2M441_9BILA|nr:hypothetical protein WR25_06822 [Diploscapter pachys]